MRGRNLAIFGDKWEDFKTLIAGGSLLFLGIFSVTMFLTILKKDVFNIVEPNQVILTLEIAMGIGISLLGAERIYKGFSLRHLKEKILLGQFILVMVLFFGWLFLLHMGVI
jgi:hypothetical protein